MVCSPLKKANTYDQSQSLLSGEEEKDKTFQPSFSEKSGQVSYRGLDFQNSGLEKEDRDDCSASSSTSALSLCFETEGESQMTANRNPADPSAELAQCDKVQSQLFLL